MAFYDCVRTLKVLNLVGDPKEHFNLGLHIIQKPISTGLLRALATIEDFPVLFSIYQYILKLKSWRSENHTPHYYWLNQSK